MEQIKRELGSDAIIIKSRKIKKKYDPLGLLYKSMYEVVVSCEPEEPFLRRGTPGKELPFSQLLSSPAVPAAKQAPAKKVTPAEEYTAPMQPERFPRLMHKHDVPMSDREEENILRILSARQVAEQPAMVTPAAKLGAYAAHGTRTNPEKADRVPLQEFAHAGKSEPSLNEKKEPDPPVKRGRGRPRKNPLPNSAPVTLASAPVQSAASSWDEAQMLARLEALERMIQEISQKLPNQPPRQAHHKKLVVSQDGSGRELSLDTLLHRLEEQDIDQIALEALAVGAKERLREGVSDYQALSGALKQMLGKPRYLRSSKKKPRSAMFIGSTGVGKTTTLVKLAASCIFEKGAKVGIINADVFRVGAQDQLNAYSRILNVPVITIYDSRELTEAIAAFSELDFIFVDTSGKAPQDEAYQAELCNLISIGNIQEIYLTVSGTTSSRVCRSIAGEYQNIGPYRVVVSKLDESGSYGTAVNLCHASGQPLSYITTGQNVPEDIQQAKVDEIIESLLR